MYVIVFINHADFTVFKDFAQEGANTNWQTSRVGKYKSKGGDNPVIITDREIPLPGGGEGGANQPLSTPPQRYMYHRRW